VNYNQFQNGNHITNGLLELTTYYSNRLSFRGVEELLTRITGCHTLSSKHISNIVSDLAFEISECQLQEVNKILSDSNNPFPKINTDFDIYDIRLVLFRKESRRVFEHVSFYEIR